MALDPEYVLAHAERVQRIVESGITRYWLFEAIERAPVPGPPQRRLGGLLFSECHCNLPWECNHW